jgi:hypothetical protein
VEPIARWLPDLEMYASDHDKGNTILGQDQYDAALELASKGSCEPMFLLYSFAFSDQLDRFYCIAAEALRKPQQKQSTKAEERMSSVFKRSHWTSHKC